MSIHSFVQDVRAGVFDRSFTERFRGRGFWAAMGYLACLAAIEALVLILALAAYAAPGLSALFASDPIGTYYPEGLIVTIEEGKVSTNVEEPFIVPTEGAAAESEESVPFSNMLVIDTNAEDPLAARAAYDAAILLTDDSIVVAKSEGETRVFSLAEIEHMEVSEEGVRALAKQAVLPAILVGIVVALIALFFGTLLLTATRAFLLVFFALVTWLLASVRGLKATYGESYVLSAYALTLAILAGIVSHLVLVTIPLGMTFVFFLAAILLNIRAQKGAEPEAVPVA